MGESLSTAFFVSFVGMITVFIILSLVVLTGKLLIKTMNTFFPAIKTEQNSPVTTPSFQRDLKTFDRSTLAAIVTAVDTITFGKGKVSKIEKMN